MAEAAQGDGLAEGQGVLKIPLNIVDAGGIAQPNAVLKVEKQAAVVQVHRAHRGEAAIHHKVFGVDEAGGVFIDVDPGVQQGGIVGAGHLEHIALVGDVGGDEIHVHPGLGGVAQGGVGGHVHDEVGRGDIDILLARAIMFR